MNGLLTALLGGAAGTGQGIQYQDDRAMKLQAQKMERLSMATEMIKNGITPPKELLAGFDLGGDTQAPQPPQTASASQAPPQVPQGVLSQVMQRRGDGFTAAPGPNMPNVQSVQPSQPGGMSGTDAIRNAMPSLGTPSPMNVGGLQYDPSKSLAMRTVLYGVYGDNLKKQQDYQIERQKLQDKADALIQSGAKNPDGSPMTPAQAFAVASNGDLAFQKSPGLGTPGYTGAKVSEQAALEPGAVRQAVDTERSLGPVKAGNAAQVVAATTPGEVSKAGQVAEATSAANPPEMQLRAAGALQAAGHAKKTIDAFVQHYGAPGMMTQLAQKYPTLGNYLDTKEGQVLRNAAINFLDASMDASGQQRYSGSVLEQKIHALIPWGGDNPETLQSKLGFIEDAMHSMQVNAGAALPRGATVAPGAPPARSQAAAPAKSGGRTVAVNGKTFKLPE